ncbi:MAG: methyltransferase family protein [Bacteroidota bacterium]
MSTENMFRFICAVIFVTGVGISIYHRRQADVRSGERVSTKDEGRPMFLALRLGGLLLWGSALAYLINPAWMAWAKLGLPDWVRWVGAAIGILCDFLILWLFRAIGTGITPTVATRTEHRLVTSGPYRYIRHPLYTFGTLFFVSFGMAADLWPVFVMTVIAFGLLASRVPNEEAHLLARFGDEYRRYRESTGAFLPRLRAGLPAEKAEGGRWE